MPGEYLHFSLVCQAGVKLMGVWSVSSGRASPFCSCGRGALDTVVGSHQQRREVVPLRGVLGYTCPTRCPLDYAGMQSCILSWCKRSCSSESERRLWWGPPRHDGPRGWGRTKLSLGALLFPLNALVFPASWLSFWPCVAFGDRVRVVLAREES